MSASELRFLADENVPMPAVRELRRAGFHVASVLEDHIGVLDEDVLALARRSGRILLTLDGDFGRLIFEARQAPPPGVLYFRLDPATPDSIAHLVLSLLDRDGFTLNGNLTVVTSQRVRQRRLPS